MAKLYPGIRVFKGYAKNRYCSICRLDLRDGQKILQCTRCRAVFHKEHLLEWLEEKNDCPVCDRNLKIVKKTRAKKKR